MLRRRDVAVALCWIGGALVPTTARAAGFLWYETGTPEVGFASAGYAARALSPSTLLTNPAGMTQLEGTQIQVGAQLIYGHLSSP